MRKTGFVLLTALAAVLVCVGYRAVYPLELNYVTLPRHLQEAYDRSRSTPLSPDIRLYSGVGIGEREYILLTLDGELGSATLKRGPLGRWRVERLSWGDGDFRNSIVEHDGTQYLLLGGQDAACQIARIDVGIGGETYTLVISPRTGHFLLSAELTAPVEDDHIDLSALRLFNETGDDITDHYDLSGGGL